MNREKYINELKIALQIAKRNLKSTGFWKWQLEVNELEHLLEIA